MNHRETQYYSHFYCLPVVLGEVVSHSCHNHSDQLFFEARNSPQLFCRDSLTRQLTYYSAPQRRAAAAYKSIRTITVGIITSVIRASRLIDQPRWAA